MTMETQFIIRWAASWQNEQNDYVPSEDSDRPGHLDNRYSLNLTTDILINFDLLFEGVSDEQMDILSFIQQQHGSEVTYPLICELLWGNQFQALQLL